MACATRNVVPNDVADVCVIDMTTFAHEPSIRGQGLSVFVINNVGSNYWLCRSYVVYITNTPTDRAAFDVKDHLGLAGRASVVLSC